MVDFRVQGLGAEAPELNSRYSILVRQQALTEGEYAYWEQLRKNSEALGTFFDPQPIQPPGNVRSLDAAGGAVLGFVGAHTVAEQRLFITGRELPCDWQRRSGYERCLPPDTIYLRGPRLELPGGVKRLLHSALGTKQRLPISELRNNNFSLLGYLAKSRDCIDCRTRGTDVQPWFW